MPFFSLSSPTSGNAGTVVEVIVGRDETDGVPAEEWERH